MGKKKSNSSRVGEKIIINKSEFTEPIVVGKVYNFSDYNARLVGGNKDQLIFIIE